MKKNSEKLNLMEVCGTHTMAIARNGLRAMFPKKVNMLSGPGCPICVTPTSEIDRALAAASIKNAVITSFGDMLHVPGSVSSLEKERSRGADVRIVYSPMDAVALAEAEPSREVIFLGVGFETTAPVIGATVLAAKKKKLGNFSVLAMFKTVPNALRAILDIKERKIDGFLLPGHVSTIIGLEPYRFIAEGYGVPCVIAGFEPKDILDSINMLLEQIRAGAPKIELQYARSVSADGNVTAQKVIDRVFVPVDSEWRAIGTIQSSGLAFSDEFAEFDAAKKFKLVKGSPKDPKGCLCGKILLGLTSPAACPLFGKRCTPADPVGPCMVSSEGSCAAEYKYGSIRKD